MSLVPWLLASTLATSSASGASLDASTSVALVPPQAAPSSVRAWTLRLHPGDDLRRSLLAFAAAHSLRAAYIGTCVGSLERITLRFANEPQPTTWKGHFEIVSLTGTLDRRTCHLHIGAADEAGHAFGGHLLDGSRIYTTAEVAVVELPDVVFDRKPDPATTYYELDIQPRPEP